MNEQKGAISTAAAIGIVVVILILVGIAYWYTSTNPGSAPQPGTEATTTPGTGTGTGTGSSNGTSVTTTTSGNKQYSNFTYGYAIAFPPDAQNSLSTASNVTFGFSSGTSTPAATLHITTGTDVTHVAYCLTVPQGATAVATTSVNGVPFLSYVVGGSSTLTGTTYYRALHKGPAGNTCYDIQKAPQGSATLSTKLNGILQSFTFIQSS